MEQIFDLPAHPLFVHAPLAFMPVVAVMCMVILLRPSWRARYGWVAIASSAAVLVMVQLAMGSGEAWEKAIDSGMVERHQELAETTRIFVFLLFLVVTIAVIIGRRSSKAVSPASWIRPAMSVLAALTVVLGVLSTAWIIRTGHEGAKALHGGTLPDDD